VTSRLMWIRKFLAPRWMTEEDGELVGYSLDIVKTSMLERFRLGLLARLPQNGPNGETPPSDALVALGRDRRVVRGLSDTDATYAAKLLLWLDDRRRAGNPFMLMQKLAEYLGPLPSFCTVDARGNWYSRAADGTETSVLKQENWDWDGTPIGERWSRFWVIVYPNTLWAANTANWGANTWGAPGWGESVETWGLTATAEQVATMRAIVADWMPAGTRCINIIVALDPASFDPTTPEPDGLWEKRHKIVAGVAMPARLDTARYCGGVTR
jgi:hypothetical protein